MKVVNPQCTCEAGRGPCDHIIGLLHLLAHYQALGLESIPPSVSKTSLPQTWHVPRRTAGIYPREIQDIVIQKVSSSDLKKKQNRRFDGVHSTLYNQISSLGNQAVINKLHEISSNFPDMQLNTVLPKPEEISFTSCKFGTVTKGSFLSYQQQIKQSCDPKVHIVNADTPRVPEFILPDITQSH